MDPQWTVPKAVRDKYEERFRRMKNAADVIPGRCGGCSTSALVLRRGADMLTTVAAAPTPLSPSPAGPARSVLQESHLPDPVLGKIW